VHRVFCRPASGCAPAPNAPRANASAHHGSLSSVRSLSPSVSRSSRHNHAAIPPRGGAQSCRVRLDQRREHRSASRPMSPTALALGTSHGRFSILGSVDEQIPAERSGPGWDSDGALDPGRGDATVGTLITINRRFAHLQRRGHLTELDCARMHGTSGVTGTRILSASAKRPG